jgi:galacturonosyltransferase
MKVLILANNDVGLYKFRKELLEELLKEHEVYVCVPNGNFIKEMVDMGCTYIETEFSRHGTNPISELKILSKYKRILKEVKPNIVFTYTIKPNVYGGMACASFGIPYVANITGLGTAVENDGIMQKITLTLYKRGLKNAQKVFFQNTENRDFMLNHNVIKGAYDMLPGSGVNINNNPYEPYPCNEDIKFLFVGRIMRDKGITEFLNAAEYIKREYPSTHFMIVGSYEEQAYKKRLEKLQNSGIVEYYGEQKDVHYFMKKCNAVVHPSYHEGLSNVLLEAASSGRPILASNIPGCRETFEEGITGLGYEPKSSESLISAIEEFLKISVDERANMGIKGRKMIENRFSRDLVIEKYLKELKPLA